MTRCDDAGHVHASIWLQSIAGVVCFFLGAVCRQEQDSRDKKDSRAAKYDDKRRQKDLEREQAEREAVRACPNPNPYPNPNP